jgi:hypothetical protein
MASPIVTAIANELDGQQRFFLSWIERQVSLPQREIDGDVLSILMARGLIQLRPTSQPRAFWPVVCSELGMEVSGYLRRYKTTANREAL